MGLTYSSAVDAEPEEVFAWHSRPGAVTRLMPPWQPVRVGREAASVRDGQAVLLLPGGLRWVAGHDPGGYDPPRQFADVLLRPSAPPSAGGTRTGSRPRPAGAPR
jgi:ligand-binding SRPBCC domain-containing protein